MIPKSIKWRLPLSYAAIALLTMLALDAVLLTTLRNYYRQQEYDYLLSNATSISHFLTARAQYATPLLSAPLDTALSSLEFFTQKGASRKTGLPHQTR